MSTSREPSEPLPLDLQERLTRALDAGPPRAGRLPVWVATAFLGAGVLSAGLITTVGCGGKKAEADIPRPPAGLETALMNPDNSGMESAGGDSELESQDPMDPIPGQMDPPPGSMEPIPPPPRGADPRPGELTGPEPPTAKDLADLAGVMNDDGANLMGHEPIMGGSIGPLIVQNTGVTYGAPPMAPTTTQPSPTVREALLNSSGATLDPAIIRRVIRQHAVEARSCYERALVRNPKLAGQLTLKFEIGKGGIVTSCTVQQHLDDHQVGDCLCSRVRGWRFPEPDGGTVSVTYNWTFSPPQP